MNEALQKKAISNCRLFLMRKIVRKICLWLESDSKIHMFSSFSLVVIATKFQLSIESTVIWTYPRNKRAVFMHCEKKIEIFHSSAKRDVLLVIQRQSARSIYHLSLCICAFILRQNELQLRMQWSISIFFFWIVQIYLWKSQWVVFLMRQSDTIFMSINN